MSVLFILKHDDVNNVHQQRCSQHKKGKNNTRNRAAKEHRREHFVVCLNNPIIFGTKSWASCSCCMFRCSCCTCTRKKGMLNLFNTQI